MNSKVIMFHAGVVQEFDHCPHPDEQIEGAYALSCPSNHWYRIDRTQQWPFVRISHSEVPAAVLVQALILT